jgi:hypothetical protein
MLAYALMSDGYMYGLIFDPDMAEQIAEAYNIDVEEHYLEDFGTGLIN